MRPDKKIKKIAILSSGGDAPGMNASIRAIVRVAIYNKLHVCGILRGYKGLLNNEFIELNSRSVSNIVQKGGTILKTARTEEFKDKKGIQKAKINLENNSIDALIVIGGDGSFRGAHELGRFWGGKIIGIPGTIDNDLFGTDFTIGFDTAINTAMEAIDKIRDTADAHDRFFLVEVMGRHAGFIGLDVGIAGGAEEIVIPEFSTDVSEICKRLCAGKEKGKTSSIIVVAEGDEEGGAYDIANQLKKLSGNDYRVVVLAHLQRGGSPSARDRILATKLGAFAVEKAIESKSQVMVGEINGNLIVSPLIDSWKKKKSMDSNLLDLQSKLSI